MTKPWSLPGAGTPQRTALSEDAVIDPRILELQLAGSHPGKRSSFLYNFLRSRSANFGSVICGGFRGAGYHVVQASLQVDEDDLRLLTFPFPPSKSWDSMCAPSPVSEVLELKFWAS